MISPNKVIPIEGSALGKVGVILAQGPNPMDLRRLYHSVAEEFESLDQFLLSLDILYLLERVQVDFNTQIVTYAD